MFVSAARRPEPRSDQAAKHQLLLDVFGYHTFRPGQEEVVDAVLAGRPTLAVMPTGAGKSLCYQLPALVIGGLTVVVSPLIALMDDQVAALRLNGVAADAVHSGRSREENVEAWRRAASGETRLLYLAPERLMTERMIAALCRLPLSLFAIDEAHCISQWGHSFRAEYLTLGRLRDFFPNVPIVALTATADRTTRDDIVERLFGGRASMFVAGFDRPNISLAVSDKKDANAQIESFVRARPEMSGIVYRLSRKKVEETARRLAAAGVHALPYHAGMEAGERAANQEAFLAEPGIVMVATVAFGMGIDKSDVRFVVHGDIPGSLESYYQEIGRAGRDGAPAEAMMVYGLEDMRMRRRFIDDEGSGIERKRVESRRLDALIGFCETTACRRVALLSYFGEETQPCGNCDTCLDPPEVVDASGEARLLLGLVRQTGQRFGAAYLVSVLRGEATETVIARGHDRIPAFGQGAATPIAEWRTILRRLIASGAIGSDPAAYGALKLSKNGLRILAGEESFAFRKPRPTNREKRSRAAAQTVSGAPIDAELLNRLKLLRRELAAERSVPAYVVFHDRTLEEMAAVRPQNLSELAGVRGIGQAKLEAFGAAFLAVLAG